MNQIPRIDGNLDPALVSALVGKLAEETRKEKAIADKEEALASYQQLSLAKAVRGEELELIRSHYHHEFMLAGPIMEDTVDTCLIQMAAWHRQDRTCPMHIIIDSPGGSVIDGMHLFDQITAYSKRPWDTSDRPKGTHDTTITIRGMAASMAGILVQSADTRIIGPEAYLMIHEMTTKTVGKLSEIKNEVKFCEMISARIKQVFLNRSGDKMTGERFDAGWADGRDWWMDSQTAVNSGFVDRIG